MPKKVKFESFRYAFLAATVRGQTWAATGGQPGWSDFVRSLRFTYEPGRMVIAWPGRPAGTLTVSLADVRFYVRGDEAMYVERQRLSGLTEGEDQVRHGNDVYFDAVVADVATRAGYVGLEGARSAEGRLAAERTFHDAWAASEDVDDIDVRASNEVCTAPEMRYISSRLGDLRGRRLLDIGCGLGEASVYFALRGALVTASDLSPGMLDATCQLAGRNGVVVTPHLAAAEDLQLPATAQFDVIYAGNVLHHANVEETLDRMKRHLAPGGIVVTWDPLAYNPAINVYRRMATEVRTPDEHPFTWADIRAFRTHFARVETRYFWFTTLLIFMLMAVVQRRSPNRERFWKVVVREGESWAWLYAPLEAVDRLLLRVFAPLRLLCWNVVVIATAPRDETRS